MVVSKQKEVLQKYVSSYLYSNKLTVIRRRTAKREGAVDLVVQMSTLRRSSSMTKCITMIKREL